MAGFVFNEGADSLLDGTINWASDTIKARPVTTATEAAVSKDATVMTGIGSTGYDVTLGTKTRVKDDTTDRVYYDVADFAFAAVLGAVGEVNHFVVFKFVTVDAGDAVYRQHTQVRELVESAGECCGCGDDERVRPRIFRDDFQRNF